MRSEFGGKPHLAGSIAAFALLVGCASGAPPASEPPMSEPAPSALMIPPLEAGTPASSSAARAGDAPAVAKNGSAIAGPAISRRDERTATRAPRAATLLEVEIRGLEQLLAATQKGAPDRPAIQRRIAEDAVELSRAAGSASARRKAIAAYTEILDEAPNSPQVDEIRYYLALEYELAGDFRGARGVYYDLIKGSSSSKYIPAAYFAFGEMFFEETARDSTKNELAEQAYREVLRYPAKTNTLFADALMRIAQVLERKGERAKASAMYERLKREFPNSEAAASAR